METAKEVGDETGKGKLAWMGSKQNFIFEDIDFKEVVSGFELFFQVESTFSDAEIISNLDVDFIANGPGRSGKTRRELAVDKRVVTSWRGLMV